MTRPPRPLNQTLLVPLCALVVLIAAVSGIVRIGAVERGYRETMLVGADQLSRGLASATWHAMLADDRQAAYDTMQVVARQPGIGRIRIFNKEGRVMFSTALEAGRLVDKNAEACVLCHASAEPLVRVETPSEQTARAGRIVSDLLAFSRRSKPQRAPADLNAIVRTTVGLVSHKLKLPNVEASLELDDTLVPLPCDVSQMQQVVLNLVMNAAEATRPHGSGCVRVVTRRTADGVVLAVSDAGEGIPRETLDRIFDPFFTTKGEGKGVGLGLAVVYGIVESHGGRIEVETAPGRGTTFEVTLPIGPEAGTGGAEVAEHAAREV